MEGACSGTSGVAATASTGHAIPAFERAIARAPDNATYYYHLGLAHLQAGHEKQGRTALQRALALKADFAGAPDARARLAAPPGGRHVRTTFPVALND